MHIFKIFLKSRQSFQRVPVRIPFSSKVRIILKVLIVIKAIRIYFRSCSVEGNVTEFAQNTGLLVEFLL